MNITEYYTPKELFEVTAKLAGKYTGHESTSVTYEKGRQLMEAVLYCISEYEREETSEICVLDSKAGPGAEYVYRKGYELVLRKTKKMLGLYHLLLKKFNAYGNHNYSDTVLLGIPEFFRRYDARFEPQNHILTLDYPVLASMEEVRGIDAIEQYLCAVRLEQRFMGAFPEDYVLRVLKEYDPGYEDQIYNICKIFLRNVLGRMLTEAKAEPDAQNMGLLLSRLIDGRWGRDELMYRYLSIPLNDFEAEYREGVWKV